MATKEAVFSLRVETGNSVQDVQNFDKAVSNLNKDIKQVQQTAQQGTGIDTFDAKLQELNARVEAGGLTMRELTQTMKAYQTIAAQAGMESPVGQQAIQAAGQLKDQIGDLKAATTALSSDFVGLDTALAGIETGAAVFQGFQSAIALTGVENEKLVQTMVKLQAVQGVVNAVNTVAKNLNSDAILGIQVRNVLTKIQTAFIVENTAATAGNAAATSGMSLAQKAAAISTNLATLAMKALNAVMKANPIFLIIAGIGAIVAAFAYFTRSTETAKEANDKLNSSIDRQNSLFESNQAKIEKNADNRRRLLIANGASEEQLHQDTLRRLKEEENARVAQMKMIESQNQRRRQIYQKAYEEENWDLAKDIASKIKEDSKKYKELALNNKEYQISVKEENKKFNDDQLTAEKAARDKAAQAAKIASDQRKADLEKVRAAEKEYTTSLLADKEQEILKEQEKYAELIKLAQKYGQDTTTLQLALKNSLNEIDLKYRKLELENAKKNMEDMLAADEAAWNTEKSIMDLRAKYIVDDQEREKQERQNAYQQELVDLQNAFEKKLLTEQEYQNAVKVATQRFKKDILDIEAQGNDKAFRNAQGYLQAQITQDDTNWKARQALLDLQKQEELANTELTEGEKLAIEAKYAAESAKLLEARIQRIADVGQYIKDEVGDIFQVMSDFENIRLQELENNTQNELAMLDQKYQQEINAGNLTAEQKAALDKNYAKAKYDTELKLFQETEKIKEKQFKRDKALRIAQVGIDTAAAIVKAMQMFGPPPSPAGIAGIAAAVGIGLAQIAAIASTKYQAGTAPSISGGGTGISAGATGSELGGAAVNGSLAGQQMSTAELVSQTNQGNVYVLESDITGTQNKVATQNKLSVW